MRDLPRDTGFIEIADRIWVDRQSAFDVNVSVVGGSRGLLLVDTLWSEPAALRLDERVRALGAGEVVGVVNTHQHFDHTLGNGAFPGVPIIAHESVAVTMPAHIAEIQAACAADEDQEFREEMIGSRLVVPDTTFSSVHVVDLGDRVVEVIHPGLGHTSGDVILRVEDADVMLTGDLVEESAERNGVPGYGSECHPMSWPQTLDLVISLIAPDMVVVPGHGNPVDREFVEEQRAAIGVVAETIRDLAGRGVPVGEALDAADWPYPREDLAEAVRRGYAALPRAARQLPLV